MEHFDIALSLRDFMSKHEADDDSCYSVNPLNCAQLSGYNQLLVVTCSYVLGKKSGCARQFMGKRAVEHAAPWKSPKAGLSHCAWKSRNRRGISTFSTAPTTRG